MESPADETRGIDNRNFPTVMFLLELHSQCMLLKRAARHLADDAEHWKLLAQHIDDGKKAPPIDIVATCTIALFAVASIKRLLDPCGRNDRRVIKRCANLRRLLGAPLMPTISSLSVRDSWEHADERLEALLRKRQRGVAISGIYVSADPPSDGVVLRRFDPVGFTIHYLDDSIPLNLAVVEADLIDERIKEAWVILQREIVKLY